MRDSVDDGGMEHGPLGHRLELNRGVASDRRPSHFTGDDLRSSLHVVASTWGEEVR
jgi:hypothetical protein